MFHSFRLKLILSNILPILILVPMLSLFLFYNLDKFFSQKLLQQLTYQAHLLAARVEQEPALVKDSQAAQRFLNPIGKMTAARVMLLSKDGTILASTRPEDTGRLGTHHPAPAVDQALQGQSVQGIGQGFAAEVAYIVLPIEQQGQPAGALRLSYEVEDVRAEFRHLQELLLVGVTLTVMMGLGLSLALATTVIRPLQQLTENVRRVAAGNYQARVTIRRADEVGQLARSFNEMATRLEKGEQARERQLAAIAHELARPLTGMRAAVETLYEGADGDEEMRDLLFSGLEEELARLERLIGTLQNVHKHALRPVKLNRTEVALDRLIRASVSHFEPAAAQAGITLTTRIARSLAGIWADEDRLIQVFTNFLDNALKFTPPGGRVLIQADETPDGVRISISDTGQGISEEELPHIFQQFYRGAAPQPSEKQGMGLGLAICQEIITAHQGQIQVKSSVGEGTSFTLTLPKGRRSAERDGGG